MAGMLGTFSLSPTRKPLVSDPGMRHARAVIGIDNPRWREKRSRHSRRMRNPHFTYLARGPWCASGWDKMVLCGILRGLMRKFYTDVDILRNNSFAINKWCCSAVFLPVTNCGQSVVTVEPISFWYLISIWRWYAPMKLTIIDLVNVVGPFNGIKKTRAILKKSNKQYQKVCILTCCGRSKRPTDIKRCVF